ncbi:MAG TPA: alpha/beta fold hydrolase [Acidimicrobiia bacterium]|nr:alpha/beta fold hydrolase [Acidimicrobiia bacterium]
MSAPKLRTVLTVAGLAAGAVGAAYGAERLAAARLRHRPDPDADRTFEPTFDEARRIDTHDGGSLYTISRGVGPPVLLSHGVTLSTRIWTPQFDVLPDAGLRVVGFDHRGHGTSLAGTTGHSIDNLADDIRSVIEALDLREALVVGHSMGGIGVQAFAIRHPEVAAARVRGLVLLSTLAKDHFGGSERLRYAAGRVYDEAFALPDPMSMPNLGLLLARLGHGRHARPSHVALNRQLIVECDRATRQSAYRAMLGFDLTPGLPGIRIPTLVICGTADLITPPRHSRRMAELIPGARLELLKGGGHVLMLEQADEVNRLLIDFAREVGALASVPAAAAGS